MNKSQIQPASPMDAPFVPGGLVRLPGAMAFAGIKAPSTFYGLIAQGLLPKPIKIGPRASAWLVDELEAWKAARIAERDRISAGVNA